MKNYKKILVFCILLFTLFSLRAMGAQVIGTATNTDIAAFIDNLPIKSYHASGSTYIVAEDLRDYGFSVIWNGALRTLNIYRDTEGQYALMEKDEINILKAEVLNNKRYYDIYSTDIKTYLNDSLIDSYSIDGVTLIKFRALEAYGDISYDEEKRQARCDVLLHEFNIAFEKAEAQTLRIDENTIYMGEVLDGKPNGIGVMYTEEEKYLSEYRGLTSDTLQAYFTADEPTKCLISEYGHFKDGKRNGFVLTYGEYIGRILTNSVPMVMVDRVINLEIIGNYTEGYENGLIIRIDTNQHGENIRLDYFSENDNNTLEYYSVADNEYFYGYKVLSVKRAGSEI